VDLRKSDFGVRSLRLEFTIPKFTFHFQERAFFQAGGPLAELRPDNAGMPFCAGVVFSGLFVFPTDVGGNREAGVSCAFRSKAGLRVFFPGTLSR
jgi:hypothetical protein